MDDWPAWLGDLPTWLTSIAVIIAVLQFRTDRERRAEEVQRSRREQAVGLSTWVGRDQDRYGVVVLNTSGLAFHDVIISVVLHGELVPKQIRLLVLPPGSFYLAHSPAKARNNPDYAWEHPEPVEAHSIKPMMRSAKYAIHSVDFTDNAGVRWQTNDRARLAEVPDSEDRLRTQAGQVGPAKGSASQQ